MITEIKLSEEQEPIMVLNTLRCTKHKFYNVPENLRDEVLMYAHLPTIKKFHRQFTCMKFDYAFSVRSKRKGLDTVINYVVFYNILAN